MRGATKKATRSKTKQCFKVRNKTPAWNQNFAVKIACCESLFAAWEVNTEKMLRVIYIWKIYEPFLEFFPACPNSGFAAASWHAKLTSLAPLLFTTMSQVYMIHDKTFMQSVCRRGLMRHGTEMHLTLNRILTILMLVTTEANSCWTLRAYIVCISP